MQRSDRCRRGRHSEHTERRERGVGWGNQRRCPPRDHYRPTGRGCGRDGGGEGATECGGAPSGRGAVCTKFVRSAEASAPEHDRRFVGGRMAWGVMVGAKPERTLLTGTRSGGCESGGAWVGGSQKLPRKGCPSKCVGLLFSHVTACCCLMSPKLRNDCIAMTES